LQHPAFQPAEEWLRPAANLTGQTMGTDHLLTAVAFGSDNEAQYKLKGQIKSILLPTKTN
jgi:hypothetical protein